MLVSVLSDVSLALALALGLGISKAAKMLRCCAKRRTGIPQQGGGLVITSFLRSDQVRLSVMIRG